MLDSDSETPLLLETKNIFGVPPLYILQTRLQIFIRPYQKRQATQERLDCNSIDVFLSGCPYRDREAKAE